MSLTFIKTQSRNSVILSAHDRDHEAHDRDEENIAVTFECQLGHERLTIMMLDREHLRR